MMDAQREVTGWVGWVAFAGAMMVMLGILQILVGIAAVAKDDFWVSGDNGMLVLSVQQWGWVQLIVGTLITIAGFSAFAGRFFGRLVGIVLAMMIAITNLTYINLTPIWSLLVIFLAVMVIYALVVHGEEAQV
jgi:hypothetical protein